MYRYFRREVHSVNSFGFPPVGRGKRDVAHARARVTVITALERRLLLDITTATKARISLKCETSVRRLQLWGRENETHFS